MANIEMQSANGKKKRAQPLIDMTPMVDLGFLLISFFIFTATLSQPAALQLLMPKESTDSTQVRASEALTAVLLGDGKVMVYEGMPEKARQQGAVFYTSLDSYTGLGSFIRKKQQALGSKKNKLMYLIHPTENASFNEVVAALDQAQINAVSRFALAAPLPGELSTPHK